MPSFLPTTRRPSAHPPRLGSMGSTTHPPLGCSDHRLLPDLSSLCALPVPLSGSFSFQQSATVVWGPMAPSQSALSRPRFPCLFVEVKTWNAGPREPRGKMGRSLCHQRHPSERKAAAGPRPIQTVRTPVKRKTKERHSFPKRDFDRFSFFSFFLVETY